MNVLCLLRITGAATLFAACGSVFAADNPAPTMTPRDEALLKQWDKNGDGHLDDAEKAAAKEAMQKEPGAAQMTNAAPGNPEQVEHIFDRFDADHDGKLSREEFAAFLSVRAAQIPPRIARARDIMDSNGDGVVDDAERTAFETRIRKQIESRPQNLKRFDTNGDGKLDDAEWAAAREKILRSLERARRPVPPAAESSTEDKTEAPGKTATDSKDSSD